MIELQQSHDNKEEILRLGSLLGRFLFVKYDKKPQKLDQAPDFSVQLFKFGIGFFEDQTFGPNEIGKFQIDWQILFLA